MKCKKNCLSRDSNIFYANNFTSECSSTMKTVIGGSCSLPIIDFFTIILFEKNLNLFLNHRLFKINTKL